MNYARKTKIIATMGPSCADKSVLRDMVNAGMNVARFNMSHSTHEEHAKRIALVKDIRKELSVPVALMLDTRGPEIRLGKFVGDSVEVATGDTFRLVNTPVDGNSSEASVTCPDFYKMVEPGNILLINDGLTKMKVKKVEDTTVVLEVLIGGTLSNHKSINVVGVHLNMPYLSEQDKKDILFGIEQDVDYIAASFVSCADDMRVLKNFLLQHGGENIEIIAKIESQTAIDNIDDIIAVVDGIMVARGDLGVEVPMEALPSLQKTLIKKARAANKRVITATEMLESMIVKPRPTARKPPMWQTPSTTERARSCFRAKPRRAATPCRRSRRCPTSPPTPSRQSTTASVSSSATSKSTPSPTRCARPQSNPRTTSTATP